MHHKKNKLKVKEIWGAKKNLQYIEDALLWKCTEMAESINSIANSTPFYAINKNRENLKSKIELNGIKGITVKYFERVNNKLQ